MSAPKFAIAVVRARRRSAGCRDDSTPPAFVDFVKASEPLIVTSESLLAAAQSLAAALATSSAAPVISDSASDVFDTTHALPNNHGGGADDEEEEEVFSRDTSDALGQRELHIGSSPVKAKAEHEDAGIFFRLSREHVGVMGVAVPDPKSRKPFLLQQDVRFLLLLSNVPFHAHLRVKLQEVASRYFKEEEEEEHGDSSSQTEKAQQQKTQRQQERPHSGHEELLLAFYKSLTAADRFEELPYRELFAGLPVVPLVRRMAKDLVAVLRVLLLEGRVVCFSSSPSLASSATLALLALLPGELSSANADFSSRTIQAVVYRLRRYGLPFALASKDFVLQPCFTSEQEDAVYAARGFLLGTSNPLLLKRLRARLDIVVNLDLGEVVAFPTKTTEFAFTTGSAAAKLTASVAARLGLERMGSSSPSLRRRALSMRPVKTDVATLMPTTKHEARSGATMDTPHADVDWVLSRFQSYFERFLEDSYTRLISSASDVEARAKSSPATIWSRLEDLAKPVFGDHARFYAEYGRGWVLSWQKTDNYARWAGAHQLERRRSTATAPARPPQDGHATFVYPNGDEYDGLFQRGKRNGFGVYVELVTKNQYEGEWRDDKRHGKGVLSAMHLGYIYDGEWQDDMRCGRGHSSLKNVENYTGEWLDNCFHGVGIYTNADGDIYDGEWRAGVRDGAGKLTIAQATRRGDEFGGLKQYTGEWLHGKFHGMGTALYYDGSEYSGGFQDGKRHGTGTLSLASGDRYDGQWWKGYRHGEGSLYSAKSGDTREGTWQKDTEADGVWFIVFQNGDKYTGACRRGRAWGDGVCKYANQSSYSGSWVDGLREGYGVCVSADGAILEGEWKNSVFVKPARAPSRFVDVPLLSRSASGDGSASSRAPGASDPARRKRQLSTFSQQHPESGAHVHVYPNGDTYEGEFQGFLRHGVGVFTERATGNVYEGEWWQNLRQGSGVLTSGMKDFIYDGAWAQDARSGYGHCVIRGCETYSGQWKHNQFHGVGQYIDAEGNVYDGEFVAGKKHGVGKQVFCTTPAKEQYAGEWKDGCRDGVGDAVFADGSTYSGSWRRDLRDGEGTFIAAPIAPVAPVTAASSSSSSSSSSSVSPGTPGYSSAGDKFVGQWRGGMRDGPGVLSVASTGVVKEGYWAMDEPLDGEWTISFPDGSKFTGACVKGRPHGRGVCKYANGDLYDGMWVNGKRHGLGTGFFGNGESFVGEWENNHVALNGKGRLTLADGTVHVYAQ
ncbi:hypothetical protein PybrP1_000403 [[Pythium] brassicae (nom. inval.)]|nr:hypothetical protein PybrP1_000403 [[Pythium] brassicae (nom. inval.)]